MNQELIGKIPELFNAPLAIKEGSLSVFFASIEQKIKHGKTFEIPKASYRNVVDGIGVNGEKVGIQKMMIIPVMNVIVKNGYPEYGLLGLRDIQGMLKEAMSNDAILGVMFYGDCPGGTTSDLAETVDLVAQLAQKKPVGAYADGMMCSAFTYLTAPCSFISCTPKTSLIGNIGSVSTLFNDSEWEAKMGFKTIHIYGDLAIDKDLGYAEAVEGNPQKFKDMMVNPHNEMFVADMKKYRPQIKDEALYGAVYLSEKALEVGLVDMLGSFDEAIDYLIDMITGDSDGQENAENESNNVKNNMKKVTINSGSAVAAALKVLCPDAIAEEIAEGTSETIPPIAETIPPVVIPPVVPEAQVQGNEVLALVLAELKALKAEMALGKTPGAAAINPAVNGQESSIPDTVALKIGDLPHIKAAQEMLKNM